MKRLLGLFLVGLYFIEVYPFSLAFAKNVKMATVNWEPFYGDSMKKNGVVTELVQEAFRRSGHKATIEFVPWKRALSKGESGEVDIVMGAYYTKEREDKYYISDPLYDIKIRLVAPRNLGVSEYKSLKELQKFKIGVSRGFANSEEFDNATYLKKVEAKNPVTSIKKLLAKRVDMIVIAEGIFNFEMSRIDRSKRDSFIFLKPKLDDNKLYLLSTKKNRSNEKLIGDFNRGLKEIIKDGTYQRILKDHGFKSQS